MVKGSKHGVQGQNVHDEVSGAAISASDPPRYTKSVVKMQATPAKRRERSCSMQTRLTFP